MTSTTTIRDDFAGPGGWEQGLRLLGYTGQVIGVEHDRAACDTAEAAGFERIHGDVQDPTLPAPTGGYIASPPCQTFSAAGKGNGRKHLDRLLAAVHKVAQGASPTDAVASVNDDELDARSVLVLHPLAVIRDARPRWVALEQVPAVLPVWRAYVDALAGLGYLARTDYLQAEQYGVPQTRKRAVLVAVRRVAADALGLTEAPWPTPTHSKFYFRNRARLDDGVLPWVSMAEALSWGMTERPSMTVTGGGAATGGAEVFGNAASKTIGSERAAGRWRQRSKYSAPVAPGATAEERGRTTRLAGEPSVTVTGRPFQWEGQPDSPSGRLRPSPREAGILQSFPAAHPWTGNKGQQFQQIGNAIPPLLAAAVLRGLLPLTEETR